MRLLQLRPATPTAAHSRPAPVRLLVRLPARFVLAFGALFFSLAVQFVYADSALAASSTIRIPGGGQVQISSKNLERDFAAGTLTLSGNVQIIYNQQYLSCERAVLNEKTNEILAEGNLIISSPQAYIEGERAVLNYRDNTGVIEKGFVKSGQVMFEGSIVRKTGPETYEAENSYYTACTTCPTAWTFVGTRMKAEIGGYAYIKNPVLEIANVPVLWLPYLIVPLKSERQTGLLIPTLDFSASDGIVLGMRFFWAMSRSEDSMFTVKNYSNRGIKGLVNYRYMLSADSGGELDFGLLPHDTVFENDKQFSGLPEKPRALRWFLAYDEKYELPFNISQKLKLNLASDLWYPRDFNDEMLLGRGDPALENRFSLTKNTEITHLSLDAAYYVNMLQTDPLSSNKDAVHRFPELRFNTAEHPLPGGFLFNFSSDYVNFAREDLGFDDVNGGTPKSIDVNRTTPATGGVFNDGDLLRTGQRLDLQPEVSYPIRLGQFLDVLPSLQYRFTQYAFNTSPPTGSTFDTTPYRAYARATMSARTRYYRMYGGSTPSASAIETAEKASLTNWVDNESRSDSTITAPIKPPELPSVFRHEIEPELVASYIPNIDQSPVNHQFFAEGAQVPIFLDSEPISSDNFFSNPSSLQFDYFDRITNRTTITTAITNRLIRKRWLSGTPEYKQIVSWRNAISYDFVEARAQSAKPLPWSDVSSSLDLRLDQIESSSTIRYYPYHHVTNSASYIRVKDKSGRNFGEIGLNQSYAITSANYDAVGAQNQSVNLGGGFITRYLDVLASLNFQPPELDTFNMKVNSWSTDFNIKPPGNCWGIRFHYERPVSGDVSYRFNFDYLFGGETG